MSSIDAFRQMFGSMGLIALTLSLIFGLAALVNFWKRRRFQSPPPPKTGPILMNDPHSGAPVSGLGAAKPETPNPRPPPAAPATPAPAPPAGRATPAPGSSILTPHPAPSQPERTPGPEPAAGSGKTVQLFRQLDARGLDVEAGRTGKRDEYQWE